MRLLLRGYRYFLSPLLGPSCRFHPSCSLYAEEALERHGLARGGWLAARRLCRCGPWHPGELRRGTRRRRLGLLLLLPGIPQQQKREAEDEEQDQSLGIHGISARRL